MVGGKKKQEGENIKPSERKDREDRIKNILNDMSLHFCENLLLKLRKLMLQMLFCHIHIFVIFLHTSLVF